MNVPLFGRSSARRRRADPQPPIEEPPSSHDFVLRAQSAADADDHDAVQDAAERTATPEGSASTPAEAGDDPRVTYLRGAERPSRDRVVDAAVARWREGLLAHAGTSALWDVDALGDAVVDLSAAHPSGLAQLYAGRTTRLSNLIREPGALATARRSARIVIARSAELALTYGLAPTYLAVGVAHWQEAAARPLPLSRSGERADDPPEDDPHESPHGDGGGASERPAEVHAPVLLRPVRLNALPDGDVEIDLEPAVELNEVIQRAVKAYGATLPAEDVTRAAVTRHGFSPRIALSRTTAVAGPVLPGFTIAERIMIGSFVHPGGMLVEDLDAFGDELAAHQVIAALAGDEGARAALERPLPPQVHADRPPQAERGAGDLGPDQQYLIDVVGRKIDVTVDAPPGADVAGTVAGVIADAAASGRSVLYVPGHRRAADALLAHLEHLGLSDLVLDVAADPRWRTSAAERLRSGLTAETTRVDVEHVRAVRADLLRTREELAGYVDALHTERKPWGVSAHTALLELATLVSGKHVPRTKVRLAVGVLTALVGTRREETRDLLVRAGSLGAFRLRKHDTPWFGARLTSALQAVEALERAQRMAEIDLPATEEHVARAARQTGLEPATTVGEWLEQLRMLDGVSAALDVFVPEIFERSAADMIIATASSTWRKEHSLDMPRRTRRRLRKQAEDLLRPGRPVDDLHAELVKVQKQREIWRRHCPAGAWPRVPEGLDTMRDHADAVAADLEALAEVLPADADDLTELPLPVLLERVAALGADSEAARLLPDRTTTVTALKDAGLGDLVADLSSRRVATHHVAAEFDLAWWASVLDDLIRSDAVLARHDGASLQRLADRFRALDAEHVATLPGPVRRAVGRRLSALLGEHTRAGAALVDELADGGGSLPQTIARHQKLSVASRPVWVVPPVLVPQLLPQGVSFDLLLLDGVDALPTEQAVSSIARARQVVLVAVTVRGSDGVAADLAALLPRLTLSADRSHGHGEVAAFLSAHLYGDTIRSVPAPPGADLIRFDAVAGSGMPSPGAESVESSQQEVEHVVDLVIDHALSRPDRSLAVIALNDRHAQRIRDSVADAVAGSPAVSEFFALDRSEPFGVFTATQAAGLQRHSIILAVGFAKTPHGRVLHRFGPISGPRGAAHLIDALETAQRELIVVSAIGPGDIERHRLRNPGALLLADLIDWAGRAAATTAVDAADEVAAPDALLVDLAERLWRLGLDVVPQYGTENGVRIPLALGHPDLPGELLVAVVTDDAAYVAEPSLRRRDRHWVERLESRGWRVYTAFSTAVFIDPQREAEAIVQAVLDVVDARHVLTEPVLIDSIELPPARVEDADLEDDSDVAAAGALPGSHSAADGSESAGEQDPAAAHDDAAHDDAAHGDAADEDTAREDTTEPRGPRPDVRAGLPFGAYADDDLDALAEWIESDGIARDELELAAVLRSELGIERRSAHVDLVLARVAARRLRR